MSLGPKTVEYLLLIVVRAGFEPVIAIRDSRQLLLTYVTIAWIEETLVYLLSIAMTYQLRHLTI